MRFNSFIFRVDAGFKYGMGHLSRTLSLAKYLLKEKEVFFIIRTDNENMVNQFVSGKHSYENYPIKYISSDIDIYDELGLLVSEVINKQAFLILDHYDAREDYQLYLKHQNIHWFQFDSHAQWNFYGNLVMHASPGVTEQQYENLRRDKKTKFLLGTKYAVIDDKFKSLHNKVSVRSELKRILISFGAGNDSGAVIKCLSLLNESNLLSSYNFDIAIGEKNNYINEIRSIISEFPTVKLRINERGMDQLMSECDLGIISPGTLSYEAASLGLPMLLIAIATNQNINLKGWQNIAAAISLGQLKNFSENDLCDSIRYLSQNTNILGSMSKNGLESVDGKGCERITESILSI